MDFSQPILNLGLQIMIRINTTASYFWFVFLVATDKTQGRVENKGLVILQSLFSKLFWEVMGIFMILIIILAHMYLYLSVLFKCDCIYSFFFRFYFIEKYDEAIRKSYSRGGLEDSVWWASSICMPFPFISLLEVNNLTQCLRVVVKLCRKRQEADY